MDFSKYTFKTGDLGGMCNKNIVLDGFTLFLYLKVIFIHSTNYLAVKQIKVFEEEQANGQVPMIDRQTGLATTVSTMLLKLLAQ